MCIYGYIVLEIGTSTRRMIPNMALGKPGRIYMTLFLAQQQKKWEKNANHANRNAEAPEN
jgi:hypothetical protein